MSTTTFGYWNWTGWCVVTFSYDLRRTVYVKQVARPRGEAHV